jgi:hypothetical protein
MPAYLRIAEHIVQELLIISVFKVTCTIHDVAHKTHPIRTVIYYYRTKEKTRGILVTIT